VTKFSLNVKLTYCLSTQIAIPEPQRVQGLGPAPLQLIFTISESKK